MNFNKVEEEISTHINNNNIVQDSNLQDINNDIDLDKFAKIYFIEKIEGSEKVTLINAPIGLTLLEVAHQNNISLEGACEGSLACSTCHVVLDKDLYKKLLNSEKTKASEAEEDMLDLAFGLTETSRLGCQIMITKDMHQARIMIPSQTRNL